MKNKILFTPLVYPVTESVALAIPSVNFVDARSPDTDVCYVGNCRDFNAANLDYTTTNTMFNFPFSKNFRRSNSDRPRCGSCSLSKKFDA